MRAKLAVLLFVVPALTSLLITVGSLLFLQTVDYADFGADRFGFPYYWVEHVYVTFAGPADNWNVLKENFVVNVALFYAASFAVLCLALVLKSRKQV